jgi:hypothetical protein
MWFIFAFRTSRAANASLRRGRAATRVEVSLGGAWRADSTRVWVRNSRGDLERLAAGERVIAFDQPMSRAAVLPTIRCSSNLTTASPAQRPRDVDVRCHPYASTPSGSKSAPGPGVSAGRTGLASTR